MSERKVYVICDDDCKFEGMTKEQILTAIQQAVSTGTIQNIDVGFITKIKELNAGDTISFWRGTQAEYNAVKDTLDGNVVPFIIDGDLKAIENDIEAILTGTKAAARAINVVQEEDGTFTDFSGSGKKLKNGDYTIAREKVLWEGSLSIPTDKSTASVSITNAGSLTANRKLKIHADYFKEGYDFYVHTSSGMSSEADGSGVAFTFKAHAQSQVSSEFKVMVYNLCVGVAGNKINFATRIYSVSASNGSYTMQTDGAGTMTITRISEVFD